MTKLPIERAPENEVTPRRSTDLIVQAVLAGAISGMATVAAVFPSDPVLSGEALVGLYAAALAYVFGVGNGVRLARDK